MSFRDKFYFSILKSLNENRRYYINNEAKRTKIEKKLSKCAEKLTVNSEFLYEIYTQGKNHGQPPFNRINFYNLMRYCDNQKIIDMIVSEIYDKYENNVEEMVKVSTNFFCSFNDYDFVIFNSLMKYNLNQGKIDEQFIEDFADAVITLPGDNNDLYAGEFLNFAKENLPPELTEKYIKSAVSMTLKQLEDLNVDKAVLNRFKTMVEKRIKNGMIDFTDIVNMKDYSPEEILSYTKIGSTVLSGLTEEQIKNINVKGINQVLKMAETKYGEMGFYVQTNIVACFVAFGQQRTMELINGMYGELDLETFHRLFDGIRVDSYDINPQTGNIEYNDAQKKLNTFLFASGPNDPNANIKKIISEEISPLELPIPRLVNEWELHYDFLKGSVDLKKIKEQLTRLEIDLPPNLYELEPILKLTGLDAYDAVVDSFEKMSARTHSTIPKVSGEINGMEYEILDINDPKQMTVGYQTHCCFTFGGASESALKDACSSESSRIFVLKENGRIVAQSWVWRNGNTMCFDNIEVVGTDKSGTRSKRYYMAYEAAAQEMIRISNETEKRPIEAVTIGLGYTKIDLPGDKLTGKIVLPGSKLYTDASEQVMVAHVPTFERCEAFKVVPIYQDERKKASYIDPQQSDLSELDKATAHINKINYSSDPKTYKPCDLENYTFVTCGQDWYIAITTEGQVLSNYHSSDPRSANELKSNLDNIKSKIREGTLQQYLNDIVNVDATKVSKGEKR